MNSAHMRFSRNSRIMSATAATLVLWLCASAFAATEKTVHSFVAYANGSTPEASFISDAAGNLYTTTEFGGAHGYGAVIEITPTSTGLTEHVLYSFVNITDAGQPLGGLAIDAKGNLYGTAAYGGTLEAEYGTVFELSPGSNGSWTFKTIHTFGRYADGRYPQGSLTMDASGNLYGTTGGGGTHGSGTVFEVSPTSTGWSESVLYSFDYQAGDGINPASGVILDGKGNLFGTTQYGPRSSGGTAFELSPSGSGWVETILYKFTGPEGSHPSNLVMDKAGNLYGAALEGGAHGNDGCIFELVAANGWAPTVLYSFSGGTDGYLLAGGIAFDQFGNLYGTTYLGGTGVCGTNGQGCGTVYEISPSSSGWTKTILHNFVGGSDGSNPSTQVFVDSAGDVYGTTSAMLPVGLPGVPSGGTAFKLTPGSGGTWTESVLTFSGTDGYTAAGGLISDSSGNLYGTTTYGGAYGLGSVYEVKLNSNGTRTEKLLYSFAGVPDGQYPNGKLVFDQAGNLYGTTEFGGAGGCNNGSLLGCGIVYRLSPTGTGSWIEQVLYSFTGPILDAIYPIAGLAIDSGGNLYGTAVIGGTNGNGAAFELSPNGSSWTESVIHSFGNPGSNDGIYPYAAMILDSAGNLYGTTYEGGGVTNGAGVVFELSPSSSGWTETILHAFGSPAGDGQGPVSGVVFDKFGNLYGTTLWGGSGGSNGSGTVYRLMPNSNGKWSETILHSFGLVSSDGQKPKCDLILDASGNLYGTTWVGGANYDGIVFKLSPSASGWTETILHSFVGSDGSGPTAGLLIDSSGKLYGTTSTGSGGNAGNVFMVAP